MKFPGIISGKVFKGTNPDNEGVTYGPNIQKLPDHPLDILAKETIGNLENIYEPTGNIECDPVKLIYLKS